VAAKSILLKEMRVSMPSVRPLGRLLSAFALMVVVAGCAARDTTSVALPEPSDRVFTVGLTDVQRVYIQDVMLGDVAIAGVEGLTSIDPRISIERRGQEVQLALNGEASAAFVAPSDKDPSAWGALTGQLVKRLAQVSPAVASAGEERIYEIVFDAVVQKLDPYSRYASRSEAEENRANRDGFGGIGVRIAVGARGVQVESVMAHTPAERAGLEKGDLITSIDGESAAGLDAGMAVERLRGPVNSEVKLIVERRRERGQVGRLPISVERAFIVPQTVRWSLDGKNAIIALDGFNHNTTRSLQSSILEAEAAAGGELTGLILDLRDNPGGLLDQSVSVADLFLSQGRIVTTHGRHPDSHQIFDAKPDQIVPSVPMVVLINGNSASAAEIVAAALQDNDRAVVVGSLSYGKGTVQTLMRLPNDGELILTWARFHAPSGYPLHLRGVMPDICTANSDSRREVESLLRRGQQPFPNEIKRAVIDDGDQAAVRSFRARCPGEDDLRELDLDIAVQLLKEPALLHLARGTQTARFLHR